MFYLFPPSFPPSPTLPLPSPTPITNEQRCFVTFPSDQLVIPGTYPSRLPSVNGTPTVFNIFYTPQNQSGESSRTFGLARWNSGRVRQWEGQQWSGLVLSSLVLKILNFFVDILCMKNSVELAWLALCMVPRWTGKHTISQTLSTRIQTIVMQ